MQCHVFKPSRRKGSKAVKARMYSGRYRLSWMLGAVTVALRTPDKGIAQRDLKRMIDVAERERRVIRSLDELPGAGSQSIEVSLQRFQQDLRAKRRSEKYVADVRRRVSAISSWAGWSSLQQVNVAGFQSWRSSHVEKAAKTLNEYQNAWNAFLNWAVKLRIIPENPLSVVDKVQVRGNEVRKRRAFTVEEFRRLVAVAPPQRRVIYLVAWVTGLRRSELKALVWGDVHLEGEAPFIKARASTTKNKKEAIVFLNKEAAMALKADLGDGANASSRVFRFFKELGVWKKDLEKAGIPFVNEADERLDFHSIRYTLDTVMGATGVPDAVRMQVMRHSDPKLTAKTYTYPAHLPKASAVQQLPLMLSEELQRDYAQIDAHENGAEGHNGTQGVATGGADGKGEVSVLHQRLGT